MMVADTDVLIDFLKNRGEAATVRESLGRGTLRTTVINRYELLSGADTAKNRASVTALLKAILSLDLDSPAADAASEIRRSPDQSGNTIGMADSLIAGIVISNGATLLT